MQKTQGQQKKEARRKGAQLIWRFLQGSVALFAVSIVCAGIMALADMITPQIIRVAVDNVISGNPMNEGTLAARLVARAGGTQFLHENLWILAAAIVAVALVKVASQYSFRVCNTRANETFVKTARDALFSHIERLPFSWHMQNKTGDIIQRCTSDLETIKRFISDQMTNIFRIVILLVLSMVFMLSMNPVLTVIVLAPMPLVILYSVHFHHGIRKGFRDCDEAEGKLSAMVQENLTGVRVVRAFGRERYERDRFHEHNEHYTGLWVKMDRLMSRFWSTSDLISYAQAMLVVVFGAVFCIQGKMTSGEYIAFISYNGMLTWPIRQLGRMISDLSKAGVSLERLRYIMESEEEHDKPGACAPELNGDITFEHVNFAYEGCPQMLHDINFTMKAGTTLGILGGTGSGKSTMMLLLDRLYDLPPECGRITIGGVDIADMQAEHLRRNIGIVLQEPYLFSRTLGENIGIAKEEITLSEIREAARAACLEETVDSFTNGFETFVGERGVTLSGGQKQRAAIARMLTQSTPIMIFDDSLSAVDTETDAKIRQAIEKRFGSASIILISHRITTLQKADQILVLDHGRIAEHGTHDELKRAGGIYQQIYQIQSLSGEEAAQ